MGTTVKEDRTCVRLATLCPHDGGVQELQRCAGDLADLRRIGGDENFTHTVQCVDASHSCSEAAGCLSGGYLRGVGGGFLRGIGRALTQ
jgi:hypothetical protein